MDSKGALIIFNYLFVFIRYQTVANTSCLLSFWNYKHQQAGLNEFKRCLISISVDLFKADGLLKLMPSAKFVIRNDKKWLGSFIYYFEKGFPSAKVRSN